MKKHKMVMKIISTTVIGDLRELLLNGLINKTQFSNKKLLTREKKGFLAENSEAQMIKNNSNNKISK